MTLPEFIASLRQPNAPCVTDLLQALWFDATGNWEKAHQLAQENHSPLGSWIHAYLHRKEGDLSNARYWYHKAGRYLPDLSLETEWEEIARELIAKSST